MAKSLNMKSAFIVLALTIVTVLLIAFIGLQMKEKAEKEKNEQEKEEEMADILLIVANNFQGIELEGTKTALENAGLSTEIASKVKNPKSIQGKTVNADLLLNEVNVSKYKAVVFIGGAGAEDYFNDATALSIAKESYKQGRITAAICIAPVILANAGILQDKSATIWDSGSGEFISKLEAKGAKFKNQAVVQDDKIITANGPAASGKFGETIAKSLS